MRKQTANSEKMDTPKKMKLLYSEQDIRARVRAVAKLISEDYKDDSPILCVCVLRGAVMFFADLVKELEGKNVMFDFVTLSSYESAMCSSGRVKLIHDLRETVEDRHVLVVEDIVDSGYTIDYIKKYFGAKNPLDVKIACLMDKPMARKLDVSADYIAFKLERDAFIVGYGLDCGQLYRNLNGIYEIES